MEKNVKATAILHKDVRGKELMYLKLETDSGQVLINIGLRTFNDVKELTEPTQKKK